jgi:hypothetical protein
MTVPPRRRWWRRRPWWWGYERPPYGRAVAHPDCSPFTRGRTDLPFPPSAAALEAMFNPPTVPGRS